MLLELSDGSRQANRNTDRPHGRRQSYFTIYFPSLSVCCMRLLGTYTVHDAAICIIYVHHTQPFWQLTKRGQG